MYPHMLRRRENKYLPPPPPMWPGYSGVARTQSVPGHNVGTPRLWELLCKTQKKVGGVWGHAPPENFGYFELPRSVLRLF